MSEQVRITVYGAPVPKPRQTRADKWQKRPCVTRYREWADKAREQARLCGVPMPVEPSSLKIVAYFAIPKSRKITAGEPHRQSPDVDNLLKSCADALYPNGDQMIYEMRGRKFWDDGHGARVDIYIS